MHQSARGARITAPERERKHRAAAHPLHGSGAGARGPAAVGRARLRERKGVEEREGVVERLVLGNLGQEGLRQRFGGEHARFEARQRVGERDAQYVDVLGV